MKTLDELIAKVDAIAESQGKVFAVQHELVGWLIKIDGRLKGLGDGLGIALGEVMAGLDKHDRQTRSLLALQFNPCQWPVKRRPTKPKRKRGRK